jgi:phage-related protein
MKYYSNFRYVLLGMALLFLFGIPAQAQKRQPTRSSKKAATTKTKNVANTSAVKEAAQTISNQIKNLAQFIFVYGGSLTRIQVIDQSAKQGNISDSARKQSEGGKQGLILTVRTFKNAMLKLEDDFRSNPALRPYLLQLTGVGENAGTAEEQAASGQFEQSGRTLLEVLNQLTDTLQAMH